MPRKLVQLTIFESAALREPFKFFPLRLLFETLLDVLLLLLPELLAELFDSKDEESFELDAMPLAMKLNGILNLFPSTSSIAFFGSRSSTNFTFSKSWINFLCSKSAAKAKSPFPVGDAKSMSSTSNEKSI